MGYDPFVSQLSEIFPSDIQGLVNYSAKVREIGDTINNLKINISDNSNSKYFEYFGTGYNNFLQMTIKSPTLRNVLTGMSILYAGVRGKSPIYIPMMIHSSYMNGAYRFVDGGSQLNDLLCMNITANGGTIINNAEVTGFMIRDSKIISSISEGKTITEGKYFIADIHPKKILSITGHEYFKPAYIRRINSLQETCGMFTLYLSSSDYGFPYINRNYFCYNTDDVWNAPDYTSDSWPEGYMMHFSPVSNYASRTNAVIVNTYMRWEELKPWINTRTGKRGTEYEAFKKQKAIKLIALLEKDFPAVTSAVTSYYTSTPLTYRDYTGTSEGSAYGILKDCTRPLETMILPRTHISNLILTGQNTNLHGVVGVSVGALMTCSEILGRQFLTQKIYDA